MSSTSIEDFAPKNGLILVDKSDDYSYPLSTTIIFTNGIEPYYDPFSEELQIPRGKRITGFTCRGSTDEEKMAGLTLFKQRNEIGDGKIHSGATLENAIDFCKNQMSIRLKSYKSSDAEIQTIDQVALVSIECGAVSPAYFKVEEVKIEFLDKVSNLVPLAQGSVKFHIKAIGIDWMSESTDQRFEIIGEATMPLSIYEPAERDPDSEEGFCKEIKQPLID